MMQHYKIGHFLRDRYMIKQEFLNKTYIRNEVRMLDLAFIS